MKNHKSACTTVLATLLEYLQELEGSTQTEFDMSMVHWPPKSLIRMGPRRLSVANVMTEIRSTENFKFTIVRDPIARTVSAYADKILGGKDQKKRLMKYLKRPHNSEMTLSSFIDIIAHDKQARDLDRHWREQRKEISYDFIPFDFIGNVADLQTAMVHIVRSIFGQELRFQDTRVSLDHRSASGDLIDQMTQADKNNIYTAFECDFEMYEEVKKKYGPTT